MMLQGVAVNLVAWGRYHNDWGGQMLVILILTVAACEAALALALIVMLFQRTGRLDIAAWSEIREDSLPAYQDIELDEFTAEVQVWPKLTPSGVLPNVDPKADVTGGHRDQV
jgi:NADH-quinone oxidoreductase subunit K